jgi:agmatine deiminase
MGGKAPDVYRMPAEWEPHLATWLAWPHRQDDWPGRFEPIPPVYVEIVRRLHESERVRILVNDGEAESAVSRLLQQSRIDLRQIDFFRIPTDRSWTRDYGPMFVKSTDGQRTIVDWQFNAWAKYPECHNDDAVARQAAAALNVPLVEPRVDGRRIVLEGGAIDVNGDGLLLTTEECLLSPVQARNPHLGREALERVMAQYLGARRILWLNRGIAGDDTHGHVDDLARFVNPRTIVAAVETDTTDQNYEVLQENLSRLKNMTDAGGKPLEIVPLPMPAPRFCEGQRLPASYANFYIANEHVLMPTFDDPNDARALGILAELFPGRRVNGIHAVDLVWGLGTLHCLTQQEPAI